MRNLIIVLLIIGVITTVGCQNGFNKSETVEPDNKAPISNDGKTPIDKGEREGFNLTVTLDNTEAIPSKYVAGEKFWEVPPCKSTPTIFFQLDPELKLYQIQLHLIKQQLIF